MVNTWKRQWFRTPGVRVLYFAPQSWTDASIPLRVEPAPDATTRVMVIRVEVLLPQVEHTDAAAARALDGAPGASEAYFRALGRFAEPRLRRAIAVLGGQPQGALTLLARIASVAPVTSAVGQ